MTLFIIPSVPVERSAWCDGDDLNVLCDTLGRTQGVTGHSMRGVTDRGTPLGATNCDTP